MANVLRGGMSRGVLTKGYTSRSRGRSLDRPVDSFVTYDGYPVRHLVATEIDAQIAVRHAEAIERTKATKSSASSVAQEKPETQMADENVTLREEGDGMLVSSSVADEPPGKQNRTTAADLDAAEKVSSLGLFFDLIFKVRRRAPTWIKHAIAIHTSPWTSLDGQTPPSWKPVAPAYRVSFKFKVGNPQRLFGGPSCPPQEDGQIRIINDAVAPLTAIEGCPKDPDGLCVLFQHYVTAQKTIATD
ncbi:hypothetical protein BC827DRAFT_1153170 [Russula dissimulans]|nr:hypothetical protein BC827DRAFT_1153170 [Russula dissimulans]